MVLTKELALKLLGGLGLVGTVAGTAIYLGQKQKKGEEDAVDVSSSLNSDQVDKEEEEEDVPREGTNEDGWLKCTEIDGENNDSKKECTLEEGQKMNIMVGEKKVTVEGPLGEGEGAKIKTYRVQNTSGKGYENERKYSIEGGDIALNKKKIPYLRNMESYEVRVIDNISYFVRKYSSGEEKGNLAGFPEGCVPPEEGTVYCEGITEEKLKNIKFKDKEGDAAVNNKSKKISIKITKVKEEENDLGYRVVFQSPKVIEIKGTGSIFPYTNTEFMFRSNDRSSIDVERVWDVNSLGAKVGLSCQGNECTLGETKTLNLFRGGNPLTGAKASGGKLTYEENKEGYNQGFKFLVKETVTLEGNGTLEDNYSYEIKEYGGN